MKDKARAILRRFERGEAIVVEDGERPPAVWGHVSSTMVISAAYVLLVYEESAARLGPEDRIEEGERLRLVDRVVRDLVVGPGAERFTGSADDAVLWTRGCFGDFEAAAEADVRGVDTLHHATALLDAMRHRARLSETELDALLERAVSLVEEGLGSEDLTRPHVRDGQVGPWDVSELARETGRADRIDLGALRIPVVPGMRIRPEGIDLPAEDGQACAVTLSLLGTFLQLQVFGTSEDIRWDRIRGELMTKLAARGGDARETIGQLGPEIRCTVPGGPSGEEPVAVRFVGCDGPGWMLRGVLTGVGAHADVLPEQARQAFLRTVVDTRHTTALPEGGLLLSWPPSSGWDETRTPLFD
jgi:hypothetical protein